MSQRKLGATRSSQNITYNRSQEKPQYCSECIEALAMYRFSNGKTYCQPCSSNVSCDMCKIDMYTVVAADGRYLKSKFKSDAELKTQTKLACNEMNQYTTLYGTSASDGLKNVSNFFHTVKVNPLSAKGKTTNLCNGCLREFVKKTMNFLKKAPSTSNLGVDKSDISFGHSGKVSIFVFEYILSFLTMPTSMMTLMQVQKSWRNFFTNQTDFSWLTNFVIGEPRIQSHDPMYYLSENDYPTPASMGCTDMNVWSDRSVLQFLKTMKKNCKYFFGLQNLKQISVDPSSPNHRISDFGLLCLAEAIYPSQVLEYVDLSKFDRITWISLVDIGKCARDLKSIKVSGIEMYRVLRKYLQSKFMQTKLEALEEVHICDVNQLGLSILIDLQSFPKLKSISFVNCSLYWEQGKDWSLLKPFESITNLNVLNSSVPLRDSVADIFHLFPNVEHLSCSFIQTSNLADKVDMFKRCGSSFTESILLALEYRVTEPDEYIIKKGDVGHEMYFLDQGSVQIIGDDGVVVTELESGFFFGEISLLFDTQRTATVRAVGVCHLYVLDQASLFRVMRQHPQSKDIIKEEAKRRWDELQNKTATLASTKIELKEKESDKVNEENSNTELDEEVEIKEVSTRHPVAKENFIQLIQNCSSRLKSLHLTAKGLDINLKTLLQGMRSLETLYLKVESLKLKPITNLEFPSSPNELASLKSIRLNFIESQYCIPAESWLGMGAVFPRLRNICLLDAVSNVALTNIYTEWPNLQVVEIPNSAGASKAVLHILSHLQVIQLTSDADISAEQLVRAISRNRPPLEYLSIPYSAFNESQLVRLLQTCHFLHYVCIQSSTMSRVDPESFAVAHPQYAHVNLVVKRSAGARRRSQMDSNTNKSSLMRMNSVALLTQQQKEKDAIKGRLETFLKKKEKDAIKGRLENFLKETLSRHQTQTKRSLKRKSTKSDMNKEFENGSSAGSSARSSARHKSPRQNKQSTPRKMTSTAPPPPEQGEIIQQTVEYEEFALPLSGIEVVTQSSQAAQQVTSVTEVLNNIKLSVDFHESESSLFNCGTNESSPKSQQSQQEKEKILISEVQPEVKCKEDELPTPVLQNDEKNGTQKINGKRAKSLSPVKERRSQPTPAVQASKEITTSHEVPPSMSPAQDFNVQKTFQGNDNASVASSPKSTANQLKPLKPRNSPSPQKQGNQADISHASPSSLGKRKVLKKKSNQLTPLRSKDIPSSALKAKSPYFTPTPETSKKGSGAKKLVEESRSLDDAPIALLLPESKTRQNDGKRVIKLGKKSQFPSSPLK